MRFEWIVNAFEDYRRSLIAMRRTLDAENVQKVVDGARAMVAMADTYNQRVVTPTTREDLHDLDLAKTQLSQMEEISTVLLHMIEG